MASDIIRMTSQIRTLDSGLFADHTGAVVVYEKRAEDGSVIAWDIYAASPTEADFNEAPNHSKLHDTDAPGTIKIKTAATTWVTITAS